MPTQVRMDFGQPGLLVDCHGTISSSTFWTNLGDSNLTRKADKALFKMRQDMVEQWMLGDVSAEDVHRLLAIELNVEYDWLWKRFISQAQRLKIQGLPQLADLRKTFRIAIVTVNVDTFSRYTVTSKNLTAYADVVINSSEYGATKKGDDVTLLQVAADVLSCKIDNSILIDDKDDICAHFASIGGHSICVRSVNQSLAVLNELVHLSRLGIHADAAEIIHLLRQGNLPSLISWDEQVRSGI